MSLVILFKQTINKINILKTSSPKLKLDISPHLCQQSYCDLFHSIFNVDLKYEIENNLDMIDDLGHYTEIHKCILSDHKIFKCNYEFNLTNIHHKALLHFDMMNVITTSYIEKICNIILENCDITNEINQKIRAYYGLFHFIPIYFEIINNSYSMLSDYKRQSLSNKIYNIDNRLKIKLNTLPFFLKYLIYFRKNHISTKLLILLSKYHYKIMKNIVVNSNIIENPEPILYFATQIQQLNNKIYVPKETIPKTIRSLVWNKYNGEDNGSAKCYVCSTKINSKHFECGHIISRVDGGLSTIDNLRCICSLCNKSIGSKNMDDFKKKYFKKN